MRIADDRACLLNCSCLMCYVYKDKLINKFLYLSSNDIDQHQITESSYQMQYTTLIYSILSKVNGDVF